MKFKFFMVMIIIAGLSMMLYGCGDTYTDVLRIHIRANSNIQCDQDVKLKVRDSVIDFITPLLIDAEDVTQVKSILSTNITNIVNVANETLKANGFSYKASAYIDNEYFPTRVYEEYTYPANYYDALVINLGSGEGDNWWCVAYPPLCFVADGEGDVVYKSKIVEIINKYFSK